MPPASAPSAAALAIALTIGSGSGAAPADDPECSAPPTHRIAQVQGPGDATPLSGRIVRVEGVVTGDFQRDDQLGGFFLQDPSPDDDPATSEGLFAYAGPGVRDVRVGDRVLVTGRAVEFNGLTELSPVTAVDVCGTGTVEPVRYRLPRPEGVTFEPVENMLVTFPQELTATEHYRLGRYGELTVSAGGRLFQPTDRPGVSAERNDRRRLLIDDGSTVQNPATIPFTEPHVVRLGDTVRGLTGVLGYGFGAYRLHPTEPAVFRRANPRPAAPGPVGPATVKVASFNTLNWFTTVGGRGATTPLERERQLAKLVAALKGMDADVVGLMEVENNGDAAVKALVDRLNAAVGAGAYSWIRHPGPGGDAIHVALIYRPGRVRPVGPARTAADAVFERPPLAQTFRHAGGGTPFTVIVGHLKSKRCDGASGPDADQGDGQGCWAAARTRAAQAIVDWLYTYPTGVVDDDFLIVGDLNSYGKEDPIRVFLDAGFVDLHAHFGDDYGYVFDGQWGYLDHALASPSLFAQVTGAASYHINADEPSVLDYNVEFKSAGQLVSLYAPDEFRTSDHDPVVVGIQFAASLPAWSPTEVYDTGDRVMYDGRVWEALWWTRGQAPGDPYGPWMEIATAPDGTAIWTPSRIFDTGDRVIYDGKVWEALWWTRNQKPGDPYGPWQEIAEMPDGTAIWTPSRVFEAGDLAWHEGKLYQAQWWNRNTRPTGKGAWKQIG